MKKMRCDASSFFKLIGNCVFPISLKNLCGAMHTTRARRTTSRVGAANPRERILFFLVMNQNSWFDYILDHPALSVVPIAKSRYTTQHIALHETYKELYALRATPPKRGIRCNNYFEI